MYQAAIVEDNEKILQYLKESLTKSFEKKQVHVAFDTFTSGLRFLEMFEGHYHYDAIFLDIEMPEIDGIELCKKIKSIAPNSLVVFISSKAELVFQTFEVQPFRFIRKEFYQESLSSLTDSIVRKWTEERSHLLHLEEPRSGDLYSFCVSNILYIEAQRKDCLIVTTEGECTFRCKLMELESKLSDQYFIKIHRSYLVNCKHIFCIGKNCVKLTNGLELPLSRGKTEEIKQLFLQYNTKY